MSNKGFQDGVQRGTVTLSYFPGVINCDRIGKGRKPGYRPVAQTIGILNQTSIYLLEILSIFRCKGFDVKTM